MNPQRNLIVFCPEAYDRVEFVATPQGVATTNPQPQEHRWHQRFEIVQYDLHPDAEPHTLHLLGPVGDQCGRCLSRVHPDGRLEYTDGAEVERQASGKSAPPKLLVPR